jgi:hypothetical protein
MRRKTIVVMIAASAVLLAAAARPALAQRRMDMSPVQLYADLGYIDLFSYPKWMTIGPELELRLGRMITVNPEVAVWFSQSFRGNAKLVPGATANLRFRRFFVGAGAVRRVSEWSTSASGWLVPKVQAGYLAGPARLTVSALYLNTTKEVIIGMTIGFGIGRRSRD